MGFCMEPEANHRVYDRPFERIRRFLDESRCHLAVSLHSPFPEERLRIMPVEKAFPMTDVLDLLRRRDFSHQRRLSFEYILFNGYNDSLDHADALACLLKGMDCRVNLIRFHAIPGVTLKSTDMQSMEAFRDRLNNRGVVATIRAREEKIYLRLAVCCLRPRKTRNRIGV